MESLNKKMKYGSNIIIIFYMIKETIMKLECKI